MNNTLQPLKVFISGASRGIGRAIAEFLYHQGHTVIICGRDENKLSEARKSMPHLHTYVCDISEKESVLRLADALLQTFGVLDV